MPMPRPPPPIIAPRIVKGNLGLVNDLSCIPKGLYADVIVQLVFSTLGDLTGTPALIVWDGSQWDHVRNPLQSMDKDDDYPEEIPSDPEVKRRSRGRTVTIFCYDFARQCKLPIRSGDWIYLENVHCLFNANSKFSSLVMHDNTRPRFIWRLEQPIADGLFYEKEWKDAISRVAAVQPLSPSQLAQVAAAANARQSPPLALAPAIASKADEFFAELRKQMQDSMLIEGVKLPSCSHAEVQPIAAAAVAAIIAAQQTATTTTQLHLPATPIAANADAGASTSAADAAEAPAVTASSSAARSQKTTGPGNAAAEKTTSKSPRKRPAAIIEQVRREGDDSTIAEKKRPSRLKDAGRTPQPVAKRSRLVCDIFPKLRPKIADRQKQ